MTDLKKHINTNDFVSIDEDKTLEEVCKILADKNVSGASVITGEGKLVGFVSEKDIIKALSAQSKSSKVREAMNKEVITVEEDASFESVMKIFMDNAFRYVPVVRGGKLVGVISRRDCLHSFMQDYY